MSIVINYRLNLYDLLQERIEKASEPYLEDDGIGSYEYWGAKGNDSQVYLALNHPEGVVNISNEELERIGIRYPSELDYYPLDYDEGEHSLEEQLEIEEEYDDMMWDNWVDEIVYLVEDSICEITIDKDGHSVTVSLEVDAVDQNGAHIKYQVKE